MSNIAKAFATLYILCMATTACNNDTDTPQPDREGPTTTVPISIELGTEWNVDPDDGTRAAPPGSGTTSTSGSDSQTTDDGWEETKEINEVRIIAFRRADNSDVATASTNADPFVYDPKNDLRVAISEDKDYPDGDDAYATSHKHRVAHATIRKTYGYEYRIIALAYNKDCKIPYPLNSAQPEGIDARMTLNLKEGTTLDEFSATFNGFSRKLISHYSDYTKISNYAIYIPQLFYGYCHSTGYNDTTIKYAYGDEADVPITGTLYRGMAEVELQVKLTDHATWGSIERSITSADLLAYNIFTEVSLYDYDCFKSGKTLLAQNYYSPIGYCKRENNSDEITISAWILPCKTKLAMRAYMEGATIGYQHAMGQICTDDVIAGDNATGVISPDAIDNVFYLRRNHKYVFKCSDSETILKNHTL